MARVTDWVLEAALDQLLAWRLQGLDVPLSINLSSSYLAGTDAWDVIRAKLARRCLPVGLVEVEITEGEWLGPDSPAVAQISAMAQAGVRIAIDDFGSGYSNFNYLSDLPIATLKLDKSLVDGIGTDRRARAKVSAIHHLAHELGYLTVAEGVEHQDQLDALAVIGLDQVQGYLLATPAPASAIAALFAPVASPRRSLARRPRHRRVTNQIAT